MKTRYSLLLFALALIGIGATTYTITQLTENATPGAGTIIEIYDPTATPKSGKITLNSAGFRTAAGVTAAFIQANQTNVTLASLGGAPLSGADFTGAITAPNILVTNQLRLLSTVLTATGTNVVISLATNSPARRYVVATTNLNWTVEAGALDGASVDIAVANASGGLITNTFPATWVFFGAPAPSVMLSNSFARFTLQYWSGLTNYHAFYSPSF